MSSTFNPVALVEGIHRADEEARESLRALCIGPVERLVDRVAAKHRPRVERKVLVHRTLRWVEMFLRSRSPSSFQGSDASTFLALVLASAYKMLTPPELSSPPDSVREMLDPLQCPSGYKIWRFSLPCEHVGGDWLGVDDTDGEDLWTIVIDVTAHGYAAYITACGVSYLWEAQQIAELRASGSSPGEVLSAMSQELEPVLPDEVFVEASLGRFTRAGEASVAGAGNCRVIFRRAGQGHVSLKVIGGHLLGSFWGNDHEQVSWDLVADDELTIGSDGLYEQPDWDGRQLVNRLVDAVSHRLAQGRSMHNAVLELLREVVKDQPGNDDITVVSVLRSGEVRA